MKTLAVVLGAGLACVAVAACGSRTGLDGEGSGGSGGEYFLPGVPHAGGGSGGAGVKPDAGVDAAPDALPDAPMPPPLKPDCTDPSVTYIYVVTDQGELFSFDPQTLQFKPKGFLACPANGQSPFSMAVDRKGTAFVLYYDGVPGDPGTLFRVSTKDGSCKALPFQPGQQGFLTFGMGFATIGAGPTEQLFVAAAMETGSSLSALATVDTTSFKLSKVSDFKPPQGGVELTGTGDGRLFGFAADPFGQGSHILQLDKATATVIADVALPSVNQGMGWAFGFWGGSFWMFTSPNGVTSDVTKYDPVTGKVGVVATLSSVVVGAGVSTCAPELVGARSLESLMTTISTSPRARRRADDGARPRENR